MSSLADQGVEALGGSASILQRQKLDHARLGTMHDRPALRRHLEDGEELTLRVEREHQEITELVAALDQGSRDDANRPELEGR